MQIYREARTDLFRKMLLLDEARKLVYRSNIKAKGGATVKTALLSLDAADAFVSESMDDIEGKELTLGDTEK